MDYYFHQLFFCMFLFSRSHKAAGDQVFQLAQGLRAIWGQWEETCREAAQKFGGGRIRRLVQNFEHRLSHIRSTKALNVILLLYRALLEETY